MAFTLSYTALIELALDVIGIGASLKSMSSTGLTLGQMKMTLKDIKKMVKIILSAPLQIAGKKTLSAINFLENKQIKLAVQQFWFALQDAQQAFEFAISQGNSIENLEHAAKASQIIVLAKLRIYCFCTNIF